MADGEPDGYSGGDHAEDAEEDRGEDGVPAHVAEATPACGRVHR